MERVSGDLYPGRKQDNRHRGRLLITTSEFGIGTRSNRRVGCLFRLQGAVVYSVGDRENTAGNPRGSTPYFPRDPVPRPPGFTPVICPLL